MVRVTWNLHDRARLAEDITLLSRLTAEPAAPNENEIPQVPTQDDPSRCLSLKQERLIADAFAYLSKTTENPDRVTAVCVEESRKRQQLTIVVAVNSGTCDSVVEGLSQITAALEAIASESMYLEL